MQNKLPPYYHLSREVSMALRQNQPVVALETAVLTHGLPHPQNIQLSQSLEEEVRRQGAVPATIGILNGKIHIGLTSSELEDLGDTSKPSRKISRRDFGIALARQERGGTTVAGTLICAQAAGIRVFATGGIGGVHRNAPFDVSADLPELSRNPLIVVCAGAKAILDLPATLEYLETMGVPVIGYQTNEFPAFYSRESGLPVTVAVQTPEEVAQIAQTHWGMGLQSAVLVVVPPPAEVALPREEIEGIIEQANREAHEQHITGAAVTPFLLARVSELSGGSSLRANLALLKNNARLAAQISRAMMSQKYAEI